MHLTAQGLAQSGARELPGMDGTAVVLREDEWRTIVSLLGQFPFNQVAQLIAAIMRQQPQQQALQGTDCRMTGAARGEG